MECLYWNKKVEYKVALYENYKLWEPLNVEEGWTNIKIQVSKQLKKYFVHKSINDFLVANKDKFLLSVIYRDDTGMDMLPCFTETMKYGESIEDARKRFMLEELFSGSEVEYLAENKWRNQQIYTIHTNIKNILCDSQNTIEDKRKDNRSKKVNLMVVIDKKEDAEDFIDNWRSNRHNLGTLSERLHMIDLCLVKVNDIM